MAKTALLFVLAFTVLGATYGMDCSLGTSDNVIEEYLRSCPSPLGPESKSYCCWSPSGNSVHCCNLIDFVFNSISLIPPLIIICIVTISCLCCTCCCVYKCRRGRSMERLHLQQQQLQMQQQHLLSQQHQQLKMELQRQQIFATQP